MPITTYLDKVIYEVERMQEKHNKIYDSNLFFAYRGEPRDYGGTKLMPSLYRNSGFEVKEKYLFELFCDYHLISDLKSEVDKAIETQHYAGVSRMLDITFNVLVAMYFACNNCKDEDGYIYTFGFPEYFSPHSNYVNQIYNDVLTENNNISYFRNFKVISHSYSNERIKAQEGGFILFPGKEFQQINSIYYKSIRIKAEDKIEILKELDMLFQVNEAALFPEKEKIANVIKSKFELNDYFIKDLSIKEEIECSFRRINYEISLLDKYNYKNSMRLLRKEKNDLIKYVQSQEKLQSKEKNDFILQINAFFSLTKLVLKGGNDNDNAAK